MFAVAGPPAVRWKCVKGVNVFRFHIFTFHASWLWHSRNLLYHLLSFWRPLSVNFVRHVIPSGRGLPVLPAPLPDCHEVQLWRASLEQKTASSSSSSRTRAVSSSCRERESWIRSELEAATSRPLRCRRVGRRGPGATRSAPETTSRTVSTEYGKCQNMFHCSSWPRYVIYV